MDSKANRRNELYQLLGECPSRERPISAKEVVVERKESYILEKLLLDLNGIEPVPTFFVHPPGEKKPRPTILYNHSHSGKYALGKDELIHGLDTLQKPPYAEVLTALGYNVLGIDAWAFGERRGRTESEIFKEMLWNGQVMWGMMLYDSLRAIDYLVSRDDVDATRLGTLGLSMGSTMAWWVAALDVRIKACVDICCLTDFHTLLKARGLDGHGIYYYVPNLLKHFSTAQINELIAPRPHLSLAGIYDLLTPPEGLDRIDEILKSRYEQENATDAWQLKRYATGHFETADGRREIVKFLKKWLG